MTKHKFGAHVSVAGGLHNAFQRGIEATCDTIQIFTRNNKSWHTKPLREEDISQFKQAWEETEIGPVVSHDSYLINLAAPDPAVLERSRHAFLDELQRAEALGIPYVVTHPGSHLGTGIEPGIATIIESIDWVHQQAEKFSTMILLENTAGQGTNIGFDFAHLKEIIDQTKEKQRLGICLDTCHTFAAGYDLVSDEGYQKTIAGLDELIGLDKLKVIHMNDSKKDLGSRVDRHEHIGKGTLGLMAFDKIVNDARLIGKPMILETPKGKDYAEDRENLAILRGLVI